MLFKIGKCKVLHLGKRNLRAKYEIGGQELEEVNEERDLGVMMQDNLKVGSQVSNAVKKANRVLGMIGRTFVHKDKDIIVRLYKPLVRPHLEYAIRRGHHISRRIRSR